MTGVSQIRQKKYAVTAVRPCEGAGVVDGEFGLPFQLKRCDIWGSRAVLRTVRRRAVLLRRAQRRSLDAGEKRRGVSEMHCFVARN